MIFMKINAPIEKIFELLSEPDLVDAERHDALPLGAALGDGDA